MKRLLLLLSLAASLVQANPNDGFNDTIDRTDPNFVKASLVIASPGEELFACAGHAAIRLECPTFDLDYVFSYESESAYSRVGRFFAGNLKMGMFAVPMAEYLKDYRAERRGVWLYELNLPPAVKQNLWKLLDEKVAVGPNLPYDYLKRGCARAVYDCLSEAWSGHTITAEPWQEKYYQTRRELVGASLDDFPWTRFALHAIIGANLDWDEKMIDKVILPSDLVSYLQGVCLDGTPVLSRTPTEVLPCETSIRRPFFTPLMAALLFCALCVANCFVRRPYGDLALLVLQALFGAFLTYLVVFSSLPATTWNWLLIPFNPLPLLFWRWRRQWALGFVFVLVAWSALMLLSTHALTDPPYQWIVLGYVALYLKFIPKKFIPMMKKGDLS